MENYKIKVNNLDESKEVQELYITLGATCGVEEITSKWVCLYNGQITFYDLLPNVDFKQVTLQYLRDLVVLKRNSVDDATHICGLSKVLKLETKDYKIWDATYNVWVDYIGSQTDFLRGLKQIGKEVKMKEYLDKEYCIRKVKQTSGDNLVPSGWIEVPEGAEIAVESWFKKDVIFYKDNGECQFDEKWITCGVEDKNGLIHTNLKTFLEWGEGNKIVWQRSDINKDIDKGLSIQDKLKFIEKWLNGEKIQYILGVESDKSKWHNFTEGAMQYIKRPDIKFREAPKYVTINGIEFKNIESIFNYIKSNFDLEDGGVIILHN